LKRISQNRDLFEADPGEAITVTVEAVNTPYQTTFSDLESGGKWTSVQQPTPSRPIEKREFTMPGEAREFFMIDYAFPPADQTNRGAQYKVTFAGANGTSDGPTDVFPPASGDEDDLPYEFRLPGATAADFTASLAKSKPRAKKAKAKKP